MSTKIAMFACEQEISEEQICQAVIELIDILDDPLEEFGVWIQRLETVKQLRWFFLAGKPRHFYISEAVIESFRYSFPNLTVILHDDQNGVYLFGHYRKQPGNDFADTKLELLQDGINIGVIEGIITINYPQKPYTFSELEELNKKPEEFLSEKEQAALFDAWDVPQIGLAQFYSQEGREYLIPKADENGTWWQVMTEGEIHKPKKIKTGQTGLKHFGSQVSYAPSPQHFQRAHIKERHY